VASQPVRALAWNRSKYKLKLKLLK